VGVPRAGGGVRERILAVGVALLAGCAPGAGDGAADPAGEGAASTGLASSLQADVAGDSVRFTLTVANAGSGPVVLEFATAQRYDFVVRESGAEVWRWSGERMFAQVAGADTVRGGGTREYRETWLHGGRSGRYEAEGVVTSTSHSLVLNTELEIPAR